MNKHIRILALLMAFVLLCANLVGPGAAAESLAENHSGRLVFDSAMALDYAENFSIDLYKGGYRMITVGTDGRQYLVVPEGMLVPEELDDNVNVLRQPIGSVYVASTGMVSLAAAIGALDHVKLVATEAEKWYLEDVVSAMQAGSILYSGSYKAPDYELMLENQIQLHIDTTMLDGYPEVLEKFGELQIPSLIETSSKEAHPLARIEWVKVLGVLFGMEDAANAYFAEQKALVEEASDGKKSDVVVAMGYITSDGKCYSRNGGDYMAQMIGMAGGNYILADTNPDKSGSSNMTFEEWYAVNKDADYLFYINYSPLFGSIAEMIEYNPLFADFKSVQNGHVWLTSKDFTQSTAAISSIIADMHTIIASGDGEVTTDHLIKLP